MYIYEMLSVSCYKASHKTLGNYLRQELAQVEGRSALSARSVTLFFNHRPEWDLSSLVTSAVVEPAVPTQIIEKCTKLFVEGASGRGNLTKLKKKLKYMA
jgi:hypothetical protein